MKIWKRNVIVAAVLVFVCAGIYLNWRFEEKKKTDLVSTLNEEKIMNDATLVIQTDEDLLEALASSEPSADQRADYFAKMRLSRQQSRDNAVHLLQETFSYADGNEELAAGSVQLEQIVNMALSEASIESLIVSKGFQDCVAYMTEEGISVAVADEDGLQEADIALLTDIILSQTDYDLPQIRIIEVN